MKLVSQRTALWVFIWLLAPVVVYGQCACPKGIGALGGEKPFASFSSSSGKSQVVLCGDVDKVLGQGSWRAAEFEVIDCAKSEKFLVFGAVEDCEVRQESAERLVIDKLVLLPIGEGFEFKGVPLERYTVTFDERDRPTIAKELVLSTPSFSKREEDAILQDYETQVKNRKPGDNLDPIIGKLALLAMSGSEAGREAFKQAPRELQIDGVYGEYYSELLAIIQKYFASRKNP